MPQYRFPKHEGSLRLDHNSHLDSTDIWSSVDYHYDHSCYVWVSPEQKDRAIEKCSVWCLKWFPKKNGLIYHALAACDQIALFVAADEIDDKA